MRLLIRAAILLLVTGRSFAIGPVAGLEAPLAPQPSGPSASLTALPAAAASPEGFFAAWFDSSDPMADPRLVGTRLSKTGEVIDALPITLAPRAFASRLDVAWNGTVYVVTSGAESWFITPAGAVSGPIPATFSVTARNVRGEVVLVEPAGSTKLWFVESNGTRTNPVTLSSSALDVHVVTPLESDWVVLASDAIGKVFWYRVNRGGVVVSGGIQTTLSQSSFAASPFEIAISWVTRRASSPNEDLVTFGVTIVDARNGGVRDEILELTLVPTGTPAYTTEPVVTFDGTSFAFFHTVLAADEHRIRVISGGNTSTVVRSDLRHPINDLAVAAGAGNLLLWQVVQPRSSRPGSIVVARVFGRVPDLAGPLPPVLLTRGPATQLQPRAVAGPNGVFTAWREVGATGRIAGRFLPSTGTAGTRFDISTGAGDAETFALAASADTFLVTWREVELAPLFSGEFAPLRLRILLRRHDANGIALDAAPIVLVDTPAPGAAFEERRLSAIHDGTVFLVAFVGESGRMYAARVPSRGAPGAPVVRTSEETPQAGPVLARLGGRTVVLWNTDTLRAAALRDNLLLETPLTLLDQGEIVFDAASNGNELLVAWSTGTCLGTRRYTPALIPLEPAQAVLCDGRTYRTAVTWDGERWWFAAGSTLATQPLRAWRLGITGIAEPPLTLAVRERRPIEPALVRLPSGLLAFYSGLDESASFTWRAFLRPILLHARGRAVRH